MENCLVTKYKAVVDNDNLTKLGVIKLTATTDTNNYIRVNFNGEHIVKILNTNESVEFAWGGAKKIDGHTVKVIGGSEAAPGFSMTSACDVVMEIEGKYDIETFSIQYVSSIKGGIDSLYSTLEVLQLEGNTMSFNTSSFKKFTNLTEINLGTNFSSFTGNLGDLADLTLLEELRAGKATNYISGDISVLGKLTALTTFYMSGNNNITGTLESFVAAQRTNGRTTESTGINFAWGLYGVTFNGAAISRTHSCTLTWTADSITYDGVTISA